MALRMKDSAKGCSGARTSSRKVTVMAAASLAWRGAGSAVGEGDETVDDGGVGAGSGVMEGPLEGGKGEGDAGEGEDGVGGGGCGGGRRRR